ncbi:MAG: putative transport system permease protein, partial [bacterium]
MVGMTWLKGLLVHRPSRLIATIAGVAVAVALIASIGSFLSSTSSKMTSRAIQRVAVDWQVEAAAGTSPQSVLKTVRGRPDVKKALPVQFT